MGTLGGGVRRTEGVPRRDRARPRRTVLVVLVAAVVGMLASCAAAVAGAAPAAAAGGVGDGAVLAFGAVGFRGSPGGGPVAAVAVTPDGGGYWVATTSGGVYNYGNAGFFGTPAPGALRAPVVAAAAAPDGAGYWLASSDGGVFAFGSAKWQGSAAGLPLRRPIVGMAATADGGGYWLVASDGGVFNFGSAGFFGSAGGLPLVRPIVGMAAAPAGAGYWLVAADGGVFNYGQAPFHGSAGGTALHSPVVGMAVAPGAAGYWLAAADGGVFSYGSAPFSGSGVGQVPPGKVVVGIGAARSAAGYALALAADTVVRGAFGPGVADLQRRLLALGYWTPVDGRFSELTRQAVYALEKAAGLPRRGSVGPAERRLLEEGFRPTPRTGFGYTVEIDKSRQIIMVVRDGVAVWTFNTSTGNERPYYSGGRRAIAHTPEGRFAVYSAINGLRRSALGTLWRPRYFTGGYAVHGSPSIPPYPASHGCARLSNAAIDFVWAANLLPIGTPVWVYS